MDYLIVFAIGFICGGATAFVAMFLISAADYAITNQPRHKATKKNEGDTNGREIPDSNDF